jgi:hypothetical protein
MLIESDAKAVLMSELFAHTFRLDDQHPVATIKQHHLTHQHWQANLLLLPLRPLLARSKDDRDS